MAGWVVVTIIGRSTITLPARVHPCAVKYNRLWERLIEYLDELGIAREVPGGIEVTFEQFPGVTRTVEVVMTLADWDDYVTTMYGTDDPRATALRGKVFATPDWARYLVYDGTYDWGPSQTRELLEEDFDPSPGEWVGTDDDGSVIDRFADFDDPS